MIRRADVTVSDAQGTPEGGVYITVRADTGALATLYNDAGSLMANPFQSDSVTGAFAYNIADGDAGTFTEEYRITALGPARAIQAVDLSVNSVAIRYAATRSAMALMGTTLPVLLTETNREGNFVFRSSNLSALVTADPYQIIYVAPASDATGVSGAWVRTGWDAIDARWSGAAFDSTPYGAAGTDDGAKIAAAVALSKALAENVYNSIYKSGPPVKLPPGKAVYMGSTTLDLTHTVHVEGAGSGFNGTSSGSVLRWAAGVTGIRLQAHNTSGAGTVDGVAHFSAAGSKISGVHLIGGWNPGVTAEGEFHGIHAKVRFEMDDFIVEGFQGDGLYINASAGAGDATEGNANLFRVSNGAFVLNRNGSYVRGADANAGSFDNVDFSYNRAKGADEGSFLGNGYNDCHASGNGTTYAGAPYTVAEKNLRWFGVKKGQAVGAATNSPPATATDNTWWEYLRDGNPSTFVPTWAGGLSWREGGAYSSPGVTNVSLFNNCYSEGDQAASHIDGASIVVGGLHGAPIKGTATYIRNIQGATTLDAITILGLARFAFNLNFFGPAGTEPAADAVTYFENTNATHTLQFRSWSGGVGQVDGQVSCTRGGSLALSHTNEVRLLAGGTYTAGVGPGYVYPGTDNAYDLGFSAAAFRWRNVYAMTGNFGTAVTSAGGITSTGGGIGYATGAGGQVTQSTNKGTAVTLNKLTGDITLNNASLAANTAVSFTFNNSQINAHDELRLWVKSGEATPGSYLVTTSGNGAGVRTVVVRNLTAGSLSEAVVVGFSVERAVIA